MTARKRRSTSKQASVVPEAAPVRAPSECERQAISKTYGSGAPQHRVRVSLDIKRVGDGKAVISSPHSDQLGWQRMLENAFGSSSHEFTEAEMSALMNFLRKPDGSVDQTALNSMLAVIDGTEPRNELEAMLVAEMAVTHFLSMKTARTLKQCTTIQQQDSAGLALSRLSRTFTMQLETLSKLRRGGEQKVRVEHVHVYPGGQAIVGSVTHNRGEVSIEKQQQPHAASYRDADSFAGSSQMWGEDAQREAVPVTSGEGKETLPHARRGIRKRGAKG